MPNKKSQKNKKLQTHRRRYKRGGCGSCKSDPSFLKGGSSDSLDLAIHKNPSVISYNQSQGSSIDPIDPSQITSVRMQPNMISGGSRKKSAKKRVYRRNGKKQKRRTLKGGNIADPSAANAISSFGNTTGFASAFNIMTGTQGVNSSVTSQPIGDTPFGKHNPALI